MRKTDDDWTHLEDSIIEEYLTRYNSLSASEIVDKIKADRPEGIKSIRYEGTSLYQHVLYVRRTKVA